MNIFHGISVPMPCRMNTNRIRLNRSCGGLISIFARSIVMPAAIYPKQSKVRVGERWTKKLLNKFASLLIFVAHFVWTCVRSCVGAWMDSGLPLKFNSSFGKLLASQAGVKRTGSAKNGAFSTSEPPSANEQDEITTLNETTKMWKKYLCDRMKRSNRINREKKNCMPERNIFIIIENQKWIREIWYISYALLSVIVQYFSYPFQFWKQRRQKYESRNQTQINTARWRTRKRNRINPHNEEFQ